MECAQRRHFTWVCECFDEKCAKRTNQPVFVIIVAKLVLEFYIVRFAVDTQVRNSTHRLPSSRPGVSFCLCIV